MSAEITITTDEMNTTTVEVYFLGAKMDTYKLSKPVMDALRKHFAEEEKA
jgi:hypothetical protein